MDEGGLWCADVLLVPEPNTQADPFQWHGSEEAFRMAVLEGGCGKGQPEGRALCVCMRMYVCISVDACTCVCGHAGLHAPVQKCVCARVCSFTANSAILVDRCLAHLIDGQRK